MKKLLIMLLVVSLMFSLVVATEPSAPGEIGGGDVEKIEELQDKFSPLDDEGEVDIGKYVPLKSKAEERVDSINLWLEENASWLKVVFGMVPSLSWLFAINLYILLFFLVGLVFNADIFLGIFSVLDKKIDLMFFETRWANVFGFLVFVMFLVMKTYVWLAEFGVTLLDLLWNYVLPWGTAVAVIIIILVVVGLIAGLITLPQVLMVIRQAIEKRKKRKEEGKAWSDREALGKLVKGATGG